MRILCEEIGTVSEADFSLCRGCSRRSRTKLTGLRSSAMSSLISESFLSQNPLDDLPVHIGEPELPALVTEGQALVVDA